MIVKLPELPHMWKIVSYQGKLNICSRTAMSNPNDLLSQKSCR